jgi:hypothetical protein
MILITEGIRQMFRGIFQGLWTCPHDKLGMDDIGDLYCKRCNADMMK